jgi:hypothetical protein
MQSAIMKNPRYNSKPFLLKTQLCLLIFIFGAGCASRPANDRMDQVDPASGYRPQLLMSGQEDNDPSTFFALSFYRYERRIRPAE